MLSLLLLGSKLRFTGFVILFSIFLAACGGGEGGGASDSRGPASTLFVTGPDGIASLVNADPPGGVANIDRLIAGPGTGLDFGTNSALALDAVNDRLYVANGRSVLVFNNASTADGNVAPSRTITSGSFGDISAIYLDTTNDILYLGDTLVGVWVFDNASTLNGTRIPDGFIRATAFGSAFTVNGIAVDTANDILYAAVTRLDTPSDDFIFVFNDAQTVNGATLTADRTLQLPRPNTIGSIFLDTVHDWLYVANVGSQIVQVVGDAGSATTDGTVTPIQSLSFPASPSGGIFIDVTNDRLYAVNSGELFIVHNVSTLPSGSANETDVTISELFALDGVISAP